jgi:hypothetical protein
MVMTTRAKKIFSPGLLLLLSCLALLLAHHHASGVPRPPAKKVLLLYAYPAMMPEFPRILSSRKARKPNLFLIFFAFVVL